jgi:hypothetical protein
MRMVWMTSRYEWVRQRKSERIDAGDERDRKLEVEKDDDYIGGRRMTKSDEVTACLDLNTARQAGGA